MFDNFIRGIAKQNGIDYYETQKKKLNLEKYQ